MDIKVFLITIGFFPNNKLNFVVVLQAKVTIVLNPLQFSSILFFFNLFRRSTVCSTPRPKFTGILYLWSCIVIYCVPLSDLLVTSSTQWVEGNKYLMKFNQS